MSDRTRRGASAGVGAAGIGALGLATRLGPFEDSYNARLARRNTSRREAIARPFGYDAHNQPVQDPRARARAAQFPPTRQHKAAARAAVKQKHRLLAEFDSAKPKGIPLKGRAGRKWALVGAGGTMLWAGSRGVIDKRVTREDVDRAGGGALVGTGVYQSAHYMTIPRDRRDERRIAQDDHLRHVNRRYRKTSGVPSNAGLGDPRWVQYFRNLPKELPGAQRKRIFARTHAGKTGAAMTLGAAMVGAGSMVAHGRRQGVSKALYQRESRVSPLRTAELATGLAVGAWGLGRSRMVGQALARGVRIASSHENKNAIEALQLAQAAQGVLRRGTARGERAMRQVDRVNRAINRVPASIRPEVATAAGALLVGNSLPVSRTQYRPVSQSVQVYRSR